MAIATRMHGMTLRMSLLALSLCVQSYGFNIAPSLSLRARPLSHVSARRPPLVMTSASQSSSATTKKDKGGALAVNYGPHIKIGKKGTILNLWGLWVCIYAMFFAIIGFLYLKMRQIVSILLLGFLKPTPEHCCWIMHKWCNMVLRLGFSAPKVLSRLCFPLAPLTMRTPPKIFSASEASLLFANSPIMLVSTTGGGSG